MSSKSKRTRIEDLTPLGEELTDEQLRTVAGGMMPERPGSSFTMWVCGCTDSDADF